MAWREAEAIADKGLSAAFIAYGAARSAPDQLEALLLMSSMLRTRLDRYKGEYEIAQRNLKKAEGFLLYLRDAGRSGDVTGLDASDPTGNLRLLEQTRETAARKLEQTLQQISQAVTGLDEIYREIAGKVPNLNTEKMRAGDARSAIFAVVLKPRSVAADDSADDVGGPRIDFVIEGVDVRVCFEFTQELKTNDLSYKKFVEVTLADEQISTFAVEAKDRRLCIASLEPGKTYDLKLLNDLPSKLEEAGRARRRCRRPASGPAATSRLFRPQFHPADQRPGRSAPARHQRRSVRSRPVPDHRSHAAPANRSRSYRG